MTMLSQPEQLGYLSLSCDLLFDGRGKRDYDKTFFQSFVAEKRLSYPPALRHIVEVVLYGHDTPKKMLLNFIRSHRATLKAMEA